jgi:general secretion pathway protein K
MTRRREQGYAMIAAVAAVAVFGYLALAAITGGRSAIAGAGAGQARAKLSADADAGIALAIHRLGLVDPARRWSVVGPPRQVDFDGARLTIDIEDDNGKIPLNFVPAPQLKRLFELAGADPRQIDGLAEALIDLRGDPRPRDGAAPSFLVTDPRIDAARGPLSSVDELELLPAMTPALFARIAPAVTVHAATLAFDPQTASPLALAVMDPSHAQSPAAIEQAREAAGQAAVFAPPPAISLPGRTVTVRVDAADGRGGQARRAVIVDFSGATARPYVIRGVE